MTMTYVLTTNVPSGLAIDNLLNMMSTLPNWPSPTNANYEALVNAKIAELKGLAPAMLDTLGEIAVALQNDESAAVALTQSVANLSTLLTSQGATLSTLGNTVTTLTGNFSTLTSTVSTLSGTVSSAGAAATTLTGTVTTLSGTVSTLGTTVSTLTTTVSGKLAKASNLSDLENVATARQNLGLGALSLLTGVATPLLVSGGQIGVSAATASTPGSMSANDFAKLAGFQQTRVQTDASGNFTWVYPVAYGAGVVPRVEVVVESATGTTDLVNAQVNGVPTNTQCVIKVNRSTVTVASLLGLTILAIPASVGVQWVHITARLP